MAILVTQLTCFRPASLVHQAEKISETRKLVPRLAAGGFRDVTRIASSSPEMWRDILLHNKGVLLGLLENWQEEMQKVAKMLETENSEEIYDYFFKAIPITYGMELLKGATISGLSYSELLYPISILILMGVVMMGIGIRLMERRHV